jgi:predicted enzyme related to lactoylglutathione lyase
MPIVSSHVKGAPCWFELASKDQKGANEFYKSLFGWEVKDSPMGEGMTYSMYKLGGHDVGACYSLMPDMIKGGIPPHWAVYFCTADADASAAKAKSLGGSVKAPPFDVYDFGRMAVLGDPEGAVFNVWQPKAHPGATVINEMNTVCWAELATRSVDKAGAFYKSLFGWSTKDSTGQPVRYIEYTPEGAGNPAGGLLQMDAQWEGVPAFWGIYFRVADIQTTLAQIKQLGGQVKHGPFDAPNAGQIAVCSDPGGAMFNIIQLLPGM